MAGNRFVRKASSDIDHHGKLPPQATDFEEAVLGAIILEYEHCYERIQKVLEAKMFYREPHQVIYAAIESLVSKGHPVDILTVTQELRMLGELVNSGGAFYITQLISKVASSANSEFHATIIFQKWILRELIRKSSELTRMAFEDSSDPISLVERAVEEIEELNTFVDTLKQERTEDTMKRTIDTVVDNIVKNKLISYLTGFTYFDKFIGLSANEILLLGGPAGHGKTRFLIAIMYKILEAYPNVSIQWFSFEDPADKMIRCFASTHMMMKEKLIRGKAKKMNAAEMEEFKSYVNTRFRKYDIEFIEESKYIKQVNNMFSNFCKKRDGRMNICIIDNLLLLEDNSNDRDDVIAKELVKIRKKTGGLIIPVHHFNDDQMAKDMLKQAYRPRLVHLKGRESYRRACTQILLLNKPGNYPDLVLEYKGWEEIMKRLLIIEVAKNRDDTANDDNLSLIRYWTDLDFIQYQEI